MELQGYFTKKGLALAAKLAAGGTLKITRVCAGAAETAPTASALSQIRQTLAAGTPFRRENTAVLPVTLAAGLAEEAYTLRELGVYAEDPEKGEVLYKLYRLSEPVEISPASRLVLRFYLEETLSQDVNASVTLSPAGLATEADLAPLRDKVEAASVPSRTVEVEAAELDSYVASLPRLLAEDLTVEIKAGTVPEALRIERFYGSGSLTFKEKESGTVSFSSYVTIRYCDISVYLEGLTVRTVSPAGALVDIVRSRARFNNCVFDRVSNTIHTCVSLSGWAHVYLNGCALNNSGYGVNVQSGSIALLANCTGSGNVTGMLIQGGIILLSGSTPDLLGGTANVKGGGLIVKANGTLL